MITFIMCRDQRSVHYLLAFTKAVIVDAPSVPPCGRRGVRLKEERGTRVGWFNPWGTYDTKREQKAGRPSAPKERALLRNAPAARTRL